MEIYIIIGKKHNNSKIIDWFEITFSIERGYLCSLMINNKIQRKFLLHRLIYLFYNPDFDIFNIKNIIDHIDRNKK
jgi:hypothetical protein